MRWRTSRIWPRCSRLPATAIEPWTRSTSATAEGIESVGDLEFRRFARQLRRWVAAGSPPIPRVEETLRRLPSAGTRGERPSWSQARARSSARREAEATVRAQANGKSHQDLVALLAGEYQTRGLQAAPSELHAAATGIELEHQPFGRLRVGMWAAKALKAMAGDIGGTFRRLEIEDPEWMRPSARATYLVDPVRAGGRWVGTDVDPDARPILIRACTDGIHRIGPYVDVCLWLDDQPGDAPITVRLGEQPLGTLPPDAVAAFGADLTAAYGLYDEAVRVTGRLYQAAPGDPPSLELRLPR